MSTREEKPEVAMVDDKDMADEDGLKRSTMRKIGDMRVLGLLEEDAKFYEDYCPEERKKLVRKVRNQV